MDCKGENVSYQIVCNNYVGQYKYETNSSLAKNFKTKSRIKHVLHLGLVKILRNTNRVCDKSDIITGVPFFSLSDSEFESAVQEQMFIVRFNTCHLTTFPLTFVQSIKIRKHYILKFIFLLLFLC